MFENIKKYSKLKHIKTFFFCVLGYLIGFLIGALLFHKHLTQTDFSLSFLSFAKLLLKLIISVAMEELVFRIFLQNFLLRLLEDIKAIKTRKRIALFVQAFLFSFFHRFNSEMVNSDNKFILFLIYFTAGLYFGSLYLITNSFFFCAGVHFLNNLLATFIVKSLFSSIGGNSSFFVDNMNPGSFKMLINVLLPMVLSLIFMYLSLDKVDRRKPEFLNDL